MSEQSPHKPTDDALPRDPEAVEFWEKMPKNAPTNSSLPPMTGGTRAAVGLLIAVAVLIILGLLIQGLIT